MSIQQVAMSAWKLEALQTGRRYSSFTLRSPTSTTSRCLGREFRTWDVPQAPAKHSSVTSRGRSCIQVITLGGHRGVFLCSISWIPVPSGTAAIRCLSYALRGWNVVPLLVLERPRMDGTQTCSPGGRAMAWSHTIKHWWDLKHLGFSSKKYCLLIRGNGKKIEWFRHNPFLLPQAIFSCWNCSFCGWKIPNLPELESSCFKLKHRLLYVSNKKKWG